MIYMQLFWTFFQIGLFTFGGGYAMLPLIQAEVFQQGFMESRDLINFVAVSESTPGPFAVNISTYVGMESGGLLGAVCATFGVVLPSFLIILFVAKGYEKFKKSRTVAGVMSGLKPAVVGLIGAAVLSVGKTVFFEAGFCTSIFTSPEFYVLLGIFAVMTLLSFKNIHPILIIAFSAVVGIAAGYTLHLPV